MMGWNSLNGLLETDYSCWRLNVLTEGLEAFSNASWLALRRMIEGTDSNAAKCDRATS